MNLHFHQAKKNCHLKLQPRQVSLNVCGLRADDSAQLSLFLPLLNVLFLISKGLVIHYHVLQKLIKHKNRSFGREIFSSHSMKHSLNLRFRTKCCLQKWPLAYLEIRRERERASERHFHVAIVKNYTNRSYAIEDVREKVESFTTLRMCFHIFFRHSFSMEQMF